MKVRIKKLNDLAVIPSKAHSTDAGFDLVATSRVFDKYGCATYGTGLAFEIPEGYVGLIFPRSSNAKKDLALSNSVGVVDSGYRGEVMLKFRPSLVFIDRPGVGKPIGFDPNGHEGSDQIDLETQWVSFHGRCNDYPDVDEGCCAFAPRVYEIGERIGQVIIIPIPDIEFEVSDTLSDSERGTGGYGSTGK